MSRAWSHEALKLSSKISQHFRQNPLLQRTAPWAICILSVVLANGLIEDAHEIVEASEKAVLVVARLPDDAVRESLLSAVGARKVDHMHTRLVGHVRVDEEEHERMKAWCAATSSASKASRS